MSGKVNKLDKMPDPNISGFLCYFQFWFPKFFQDMDSVPKVLADENRRWYQATKMFACHMKARLHVLKLDNPAAYVRLDEDAVTSLFASNMRPLLALAGFINNEYYRVDIPITHAATLTVNTILKLINWRWKRISVEIVKNGLVTTNSHYEILDQWGNKDCTVENLHELRVKLRSRNILPTIATYGQQDSAHGL